MRRIAVPIVAASAVALSASLLTLPSTATAAAPQPAAQSSTPEPASGAGSPRIAVAGLASLAYTAIGAILDCEELAQQIRGCPEAPSIEEVLAKLNDIENQIARNQARTEQALDLLQKSLDGKELADAVLRLSPVEAHIFEAAKAWSAMSDCTQKARVRGATCTGYNGKPTGTVSAAEGIRVSKSFFVTQMGKVSITIEQATQYFAGTRSIKGKDGLLHALWKPAKREQDRASGVKTPVASPTPSVLTRSLALDFLPVKKYYRDMIYLYGALKPAVKVVKNKKDEAQSEANLADKLIFAATDRWTVLGASNFYNIPDLPPGSIAYIKDGKLYKIVPGEGKGVPLPSSAVMDLGALLAESGYSAGPQGLMAENPQLLPRRGAFVVHEKVKHRTYKRYNREGFSTNPEFAICADLNVCRDNAWPYSARVATFEIGHPDAVGTKDRYGNLMKMRWTPMLITARPVAWGDVRDRGKWYSLTGGPVQDKMPEIWGYFTSPQGDVRGEPPMGVFDVQFLQTFRRTVGGKYATFGWDYVTWGMPEFSPQRSVGPGVYLPQRASTARFSLVEKPLPGFLATPAASGSKPVAKRYATCQALRADYRAGVAKPGAVNVVVVNGKRVSRPTLGKPFVSKSAYRANRHLDRDRDGLACEREPKRR